MIRFSTFRSLIWTTLPRTDASEAGGKYAISPRFLLVLILALPCTCFAARARAQSALASVASEHFILDHNRIFVELAFVRPDGTQHKALAFVDSGDPTFTLSIPLVKELQADKWKGSSDIHVLFGGKALNASAVDAVSGANWFFPGLHVEANLPATVLEEYDVVLDYATRTLTLAPPGSVKHDGARVPCKVNRKTGLISVEGNVAGRSYALAVDNGSAYTMNDFHRSMDAIHQDYERRSAASQSQFEQMDRALRGVDLTTDPVDGKQREVLSTGQTHWIDGLGNISDSPTAPTPGARRLPTLQ